MSTIMLSSETKKKTRKRRIKEGILLKENKVKHERAKTFLYKKKKKNWTLWLIFLSKVICCLNVTASIKLFLETSRSFKLLYDGQ